MKDTHLGTIPYQAVDPCQSLAINIVEQESDLYRRLGSMLQISKDIDEIKRIRDAMSAIEGIFLMNWFSIAGGLEDGATIIEKLKKEIWGDDD